MSPEISNYADYVQTPAGIINELVNLDDWHKVRNQNDVVIL